MRFTICLFLVKQQFSVTSYINYFLVTIVSLSLSTGLLKRPFAEQEGNQGFSFSRIKIYRYFTIYAHFKRNKRLGSINAGNMLDFIVQ